MQNIQMQALWTSSHILCYLLSDNSCETFLGKSISGIKKIKIEIFFKFFLKNLANTRQSGTCPKKKKNIIKVESFSRNCILIRVHANSYCNILLECMFIENLCSMLILKVFI